MGKQCIIVGLGRYGRTVAKNLYDNGVEVLAIDSDMVKVEKVSSYVNKAICMDVTSEDAWKQIPLSDFHYGVVCFGENVSASILSCMMLQSGGVGHITAKVGDKLHRDILRKLNIEDIVFPEEYVASITVDKILND